MPFTVTAHMALPMYILGLLTIDLTFDIGGLHPSQTVAYYAGFRGANMLAQCILFAGLGVGFLPYFRGITQPNLIDMICFAVLLGGLGVFGGYLIPLEVRVACVGSFWTGFPQDFWDCLHKASMDLRL